jgi:hypothetical protein
VRHPHHVADAGAAEVARLPGQPDGVGRPAVAGERVVEGDLEVGLVPRRELRPHDRHRGRLGAEVARDEVADLRGVLGALADPLEQPLGQPAEVVGEAVEVGRRRGVGHAREGKPTGVATATLPGVPSGRRAERSS